MKTRILSLSTLAVAALALFSCAKEQNVVVDNQESQGIPFEIVAGTLESKTVNDGMHTTWAANDKINLFHAVANTATYVSDGAFVTAEAGASVAFSGTLASALTESQYDWYAIYPWSSYITTPASISEGYVTVGSGKTGKQKQKGNSNMTHIAGTGYPVAGKALGVASETKPVISMSQLTSVIAVEVTNGTSDPITVSEISFTGTEDIIGSFYIDFVSNPVVFTPSTGYTSSTAVLQVTNGTAIAASEKATFYLAIKPFTAPASGTISISVNASNGEQVYNKELASAASFVAGKINTFHVSYTKELVLNLPFSDNMSWANNGSTDGAAISASDLPKTGGGDAMYSAVSNAYKGIGGIKMGSSSNRGEITTVNLNLSSEFTIVVSAMTWGTDASTLQVFVDDVQIGEDAQLYDEFVEYVYKPGAKTAASKVKIKIAGKRGYINNIQIVSGTDPVAKPVIHLTSTPGDLSVEGGNSSITYQILNPTSGSVTASAEADWVSDFDYATENTVKFTFAANTGAQRSQNITLKYTGAEDKVVTVTQDAYVAPGSEKNYTLTIQASDFNSTSYAANNGDHVSKATAEDSSQIDVTWNSNQVMLNGSDMQWQKNKGCIYNKTNLGTIQSVTVNSSTDSFTTYYGTTEHPTSGEVVGNGFFTVQVGNATGKTTSIVITFKK